MNRLCLTLIVLLFLSCNKESEIPSNYNLNINKPKFNSDIEFLCKNKNKITVKCDSIDDGGEDWIKSRGIVWSESQMPTLVDNSASISNFQINNGFVLNLINLKQNNEYFIIGFAENDGGIAYTNQINVKTYSDNYVLPCSYNNSILFEEQNGNLSNLEIDMVLLFDFVEYDEIRGSGVNNDTIFFIEFKEGFDAKSDIYLTVDDAILSSKISTDDCKVRYGIRGSNGLYDYYYCKPHQEIFVDINESWDFSVTFCNLQFSNGLVLSGSFNR